MIDDKLTPQEKTIILLLRELKYGQLVITKEGDKIVNAKKTESIIV